MNLIEVALKSDELYSTIRTRCAPWLKAVGHKWVAYRAMKGIDDVLLKDVRNDRRPRDISATLHEEYDKWFHDRFGIRYRSNSVMATGDERWAMDLSEEWSTNIYCVFPVGPFKAVWGSGYENDFLNIFVTLRTAIHKEFGEKANKVGPLLWTENEVAELVKRNKKAKQIFNDTMQRFNFTDTKLVQGISSGTEIMIHCKQYYAVSPLLVNDALKLRALN